MSAGPFGISIKNCFRPGPREYPPLVAYWYGVITFLILRSRDCRAQRQLQLMRQRIKQNASVLSQLCSNCASPSLASFPDASARLCAAARHAVMSRTIGEMASKSEFQRQAASKRAIILLGMDWHSSANRALLWGLEAAQALLGHPTPPGHMPVWG